MSITSVSTTNAAWPLPGAQGARPQRPQGPPPGPPPGMQGAAKALGTDADDLKSALEGGKTLSQLATEKGVSQEDLLAAVVEDLKTNKPEGAPELSSDQLTKMATDLVSGQGPGGPGGAHGARRRDPQQALAALAGDIGIDTDKLLEQLQSGDDASISALFANPYSSRSASSTGGLLVDLNA